jgi:hypothetical protein
MIEITIRFILEEVLALCGVARKGRANAAARYEKSSAAT